MEKKYDVFISFSSYDQKIAEGICGYLEGNGIRCFVSYRDIPKGAVWADEIFNAINNSKAMIAVFSKHFNESEHTNREITLGTKVGIPILPFRIIPDEPTGAIGFYFANLNWIDAFPEPDKYFGKLLNDIKQIIKTEEVSKITKTQEHEESKVSTLSSSMEEAGRNDDESNLKKKLLALKKQRMRKRLSTIKRLLFKFRYYITGGVFAVIILLAFMLLKGENNQNEELIGQSDDTFTKDTVIASTSDTIIMVVDSFSQESPIIEKEKITGEKNDDEDAVTEEIATESKSNIENASVEEKKRLAKKGNAEAQYWLGVYYYDIKRKGYVDIAVSWWEKSANAGFVPAINKIAWCYYNKVHYPIDYGKAVSYYTKSANKKSPEAMYQLAWCYYSGHYKGNKVEKQLFKQALEWLNKACEEKYAPAQCWLGKMYFYNEFKYNKPLYNKAFTLFLQAAEQNYAEAQYYVSECYKLGRGTTKNSKKAKDYHDLARKNGFVEGK